jgi:hypothetical protein
LNEGGGGEVLHQEREAVSAAYLGVEKEANQGEREGLNQELEAVRWRRRPARWRVVSPPGTSRLGAVYPEVEKEAIQGEREGLH